MCSARLCASQKMMVCSLFISHLSNSPNCYCTHTSYCSSITLIDSKRRSKLPSGSEFQARSLFAHYDHTSVHLLPREHSRAPREGRANAGSEQLFRCVHLLWNLLDARPAALPTPDSPRRHLPGFRSPRSSARGESGPEKQRAAADEKNVAALQISNLHCIT